MSNDYRKKHISNQNCSFTIKSDPRSGSGVSTIVAPDESITILVLQLTVYILLCLLHGDVHVTIQAGQDTYACDSQQSQCSNSQYHLLKPYMAT